MLTHFTVGYGGSQGWCDLAPIRAEQALIHPGLRPKRWTLETRRVSSDKSLFWAVGLVLWALSLLVTELLPVLRPLVRGGHGL